MITAIANSGNGGIFFDWINTIPGKDKTGHVIFMGVLTFLVQLNMKRPFLYVSRIKVPKAFFIVAPVLLAEEVSQFFIMYRNCSSMDFLCDIFGMIIFGYTAIFVQQFKQRRKHV